jgi:hypothetical protein
MVKKLESKNNIVSKLALYKTKKSVGLGGNMKDKNGSEAPQYFDFFFVKNTIKLEDAYRRLQVTFVD